MTIFDTFISRIEDELSREIVICEKMNELKRELRDVLKRGLKSSNSATQKVRELGYFRAEMHILAFALSQKKSLIPAKVTF